MNKFFQNNKFITGLAAGTAVGLVLYKALSHFSSKRLSSKESNSKDEKKGDLHDAFQNIDFTCKHFTLNLLSSISRGLSKDQKRAAHPQHPIFRRKEPRNHL